MLFAIANYADKRGVAWPSLSTLARDTGMQRRSVCRVLDEAERAGWIVRQRGGGPVGNGGRSNLYRASFPQGRDMTSPPEQVVTETHKVVTETHKGGDRDAPRTSKNVQERPEKRLCDESHVRAHVDDFRDAIERRDAWSLALRGIDGLTHAEAGWLLAGFGQADGQVMTEDCTTAELVASVLADMSRKRTPFTRRRFVGFLESAVRVRGLADDIHPHDSAFIKFAWPIVE